MLEVPFALNRKKMSSIQGFFSFIFNDKVMYIGSWFHIEKIGSWLHIEKIQKTQKITKKKICK